MTDTMTPTFDTAVEATRAATDKMKATTEQFATAGNQAFKDGVERSLASMNDLNAQSRRNLEAVVSSATAAAKGAETLSTQVMAFGKGAVDRNVEAAKAMSSVRSVQELIEIQTAFAKTSMEVYMAEMNRASETLAAAMKDSLRPINERVTAMVETMQAAR